MEIKEKIKNLISENKVCLFMKGTPDHPQCGFSMAVVNVLKHLKVEFKGINVLECLVGKIIVIGPQYLNFILRMNLLAVVT